MQRQRGELVPIGDALSGMGGPVKSIREATPQALHHFSRFDQVGVSSENGKNRTPSGAVLKLVVFRFSLASPID